MQQFKNELNHVQREQLVHTHHTFSIQQCQCRMSQTQRKKYRTRVLGHGGEKKRAKQAFPVVIISSYIILRKKENACIYTYSKNPDTSRRARALSCVHYYSSACCCCPSRTKSSQSKSFVNTTPVPLRSRFCYIYLFYSILYSR